MNELSFTSNYLQVNYPCEASILEAKGYKKWVEIRNLTETEINLLTRESLSTKRNLFFIRGIASIICDLKVSAKLASILLHAGISSKKSLKDITPQLLLDKLGRLDRQYNLNRESILNMEMAKTIINRAKQDN